MKVLLISPPLNVVKDMEEFVRISYPIGLAYIASNLEKKGVEVSILDALAEGWDTKKSIGEYLRIGLSEDQIKKRIKEEKPDLCGVSSFFSSQSDEPSEIARFVKEVFPKMTVVAGGPHASGNAAEVLKDKNIDIVIIGEGEETLYHLLKNLKKINKVKGIAYKKNNKVRFTEKAEFIQDLDELPFPAYHLLKMKNYLEAGSKGFSARRYVGGQKPWATIITSRGCPFNCVFCSIHNTMGYKWRPRSYKNVVDEIEFLYKNYGIRTFFFEDDNFSLDKERAKKILKEILKRKLKINWQAPNGVRADMLDDELILLMKKTNCDRVRIAIEHGDQEFLNKYVQKRLDLNALKDSVKRIRKHRMDIDGFFVMGIPGETDKTMRKSINFAKELISLGLNPIFGMAIPLPGTKLYDICESKGYLVKEKLSSKDYQLAYSKSPVINTPTMPVYKLKNWYYKALRETLITRIKKDPRLLLKLNLVQDIKKHPLRGARIVYSFIKNSLK